jgi:hypothetical protein
MQTMGYSIAIGGRQRRCPDRRKTGLESIGGDGAAAAAAAAAAPKHTRGG